MKVLTIRALSLDGNAESKDSEPFHLSKLLMPVVHEEPQLVQRTPKQVKPIPIVASTSASTPPTVVAPQQQQQQAASNNPLAALKNPLTSLFNTVNNEVTAFNENSKKGMTEVKQQLQQPVNVAQSSSISNSTPDENKQAGLVAPGGLVQMKVPVAAAGLTQVKPQPNKISNITGLGSIPRSNFILLEIYLSRQKFRFVLL